jgi:hypothetical protein
MSRMTSGPKGFAAGLEKTQVLLKQPAGRLNTGFSGKTGFLKQAF